MIPGRVIEKPGVSRRALTAPLGGVITHLNVVPGQAIESSDVLFTIRVTDEELITAQLNLLKTIARVDVIKTETTRLKPLTEKGLVQASRKRELDYESQQLRADKDRGLQELRLRGLSPQHIATILTSGQLVESLQVRIADADDKTVNQSYTVGEVNVTIGGSVRRGDTLCHLAEHAELFIQGDAFENDVAAIDRVKDLNWGVTAEFGHTHETDHKHIETLDDLHVLYIASHVDSTTQTFHFFLPIKNDILKETVRDSGAVFRSWRFKPGQRVHLRIPVEKWDDQLKVPIAALVQEGPNAFVYRQHEHAHADEPGAHEHVGSVEHEHVVATAPTKRVDEFFVEFEPVPVEVLHLDDRFAILATDGELHPGDTIALNNAYQLHLAMKLQQGRGSPHEHEHN